MVDAADLKSAPLWGIGSNPIAGTNTEKGARVFRKKGKIEPPMPRTRTVSIDLKAYLDSDIPYWVVNVTDGNKMLFWGRYADSQIAQNEAARYLTSFDLGLVP